MDAKNIYDAFVEIERLKKLVERYHKELKRKDLIITELKNLIIDNFKEARERENENKS